MAVLSFPLETRHRSTNRCLLLWVWGAMSKRDETRDILVSGVMTLLGNYRDRERILAAYEAAERYVPHSQLLVAERQRDEMVTAFHDATRLRSEIQQERIKATDRAATAEKLLKELFDASDAYLSAEPPEDEEESPEEFALEVALGNVRAHLESVGKGGE